MLVDLIGGAALGLFGPLVAVYLILVAWRWVGRRYAGARSNAQR